MAKLIQTANPPVVNIADVSSVLFNVANVAARAANAASALADRQVAKQAGEAGARAAFQGPVEKREGVSIADESFNASAVATRFSLLESQLTDGLRALEQEHKNDPSAFETKASAQINSAVTEMRRLDDIRAASLLNRLASVKAHAAHRISENFLNTERDKQLVIIGERAKTIQQELTVLGPDIFSENSATALEAIGEQMADFGRLLQTPDPSGHGFLVNQKDQTEAFASLVDDFYENSIRGAILNSDNPGEIGQAIQRGELQLPELSVSDTGEVSVSVRKKLPIDRVERLIRFARSEQSFRDSQERELANEFRSAALEKIQNIKAELSENFESNIRFTPEELTALDASELEELEFLRGTAASMGELSSMTFQEMGRLVDAVEVSGSDARFEKDRKDTLRAAMQHLVNEFDSDPVSYVNRHSSLVRKVMNAAQNNMASTQAVATARITAQQDIARGLLGFQPKVLSEEEAQAIGAEFGRQENYAAMVQFANGLRDTYGIYFEQAVDEAVEQSNLPPAVTILAELNPASAAARALANGFDTGRKALNDLMPAGVVPEQDIDKALVDRLHAEFFVGFPPGNNRLKAAYIDAAEIAARALVAENSMSVNDALDLVMKGLIEDHWVVENDVLIPARQADASVRRGVSEKSRVQIITESADDIVPLISGSMVSLDTEGQKQEWLRRLKETGRFVISEDSTGVEMVDGLGQPVYLKSGRKWRLTWEQLRKKNVKKSGEMRDIERVL